jgi:HEAT repeat protein
LEQRLSDDEVLVQLAAVTSLRWRGEASPAAIETIKGFLRHEDPGLREAVAESLGHFDSGDPRTIDALLQSFQSDAVVAVREAAARSLGLLANGDLPVAGALCSVLVNTGENAGLRAAAATGMGWISDASDEILAALFGALADENAGVSYAAGLALAEVGQARSDVVHQLVTLMDSENPSTRRGAVAGLASNVEEDRAKAGVLLRAVRDPDASVRYIALKSLASMDHVDLEVRRTLVRGLSDDNREIRDEAAGALARHGKTDTEILDTVFDLLGYADADIREAVCRGLALLGAAAPQQAADALRVALHDSNERVRYAAVEGLGLLGQPDAKTVAELLPFLSHPEEEAPQYRAEECRRAAIRSLARLGHFRPEIVEELLGEFASTDSFHDEEWDEAFAALVALAKASPEAVGALHEALHASNQNVRRGAGRCLAELGYTTPAIVRDLIEDALQHRTGSREPLHERVVERLVQLGRADSEITEQIIRAFAKKHNNDFSGMLTGILGQIGYRQPAAVSSLLTAAHDPDRNRPEWVIEALGQVGQGSSEVIGALAEKLRDPERSIRLAAERSLGQLNIDVEAQLRSALIALNRALHDKDEDVRREALASLRKFLNGRPIPGYCWKPITAKREQQD